MTYFDGLTFRHYNHLPACAAWIDRQFEYCALNFCRAGRILWAMGDSPPRFLNAPVAWWTVPDIHYVYGATHGETWEHFYVTFDGPRTLSMQRHNLLQSGADAEHFVCLSEPETFGRTFFHLIEILERVGPESPRAVLVLEDLMLQLHEQTLPLTLASPLENAVGAWLEAVRSEPCLMWEVGAQARQLGVSEVHLRRVVKKLTGVPPHRFVLDRRLDAAATLLRRTNKPIKTLPILCGFSDLAYFSRLFRQRYGLPPATYRREIQLISIPEIQRIPSSGSG